MLTVYIDLLNMYNEQILRLSGSFKGTFKNMEDVLGPEVTLPTYCPILFYTL